MMRRRLPLAVFAALLAAEVILTPPAGVTAIGARQDDDGIDDFLLPQEIDEVTAIEVDGRGNVVVAGETASNAFPTTPDAVDRTCGRDGDAFVQVYAPGGALLYSTCVGSPDALEERTRIAPARDGSIWIAAYSFRDGRIGTMLWRITPGRPGYQDEIRVGGPEAYTGGGYVVAARDGSVWVAGSAYGGLSTVNAWQPTAGGDADFYVGHYASGRAEPLTLTYLGGRADEHAEGIALAPDGDAVVVGISVSPGNFPLVRPFQGSTGGNWDIVIARLDASGQWLEYSSYFGGSDDEGSARVTVDRIGNAYVSGKAVSDDLPLTAPRGMRNARRDVFVAGVDPAGTLLFSRLIESSLGPPVPTDASLGVSHASARADGWVLLVGGYYWYGRGASYADDRVGWYFAVTDPLGSSFRPAALIGYEPGRPFWIDAVTSQLSDIHLAYHYPTSWFDVTRKVIRLRVDTMDHVARRLPGGHDRR